MNTNKREPITTDSTQHSDVWDHIASLLRTPITPTELAEWRAVVEKATPGPWIGGRIEDEKFIQVARTALPRMIEEVEALRAALVEAETERDELRANNMRSFIAEIKSRLLPEEAEQFQTLLTEAANEWMREVLATNG